MRTKPVLSATFALLALAATAGQESATIRLHIPTGQSVRFKTVTVASTEGFVSATSTITVVQTVKALSAQEGWTTLQFTNDDVKFEGDDPLGSRDLIIGGIKKATVKMEVDENGATRNLVVENAQDMDMTTRQIYEGTLKSAQMTGFMGLVYQRGPVSAGSTWNAELDGAKLFENNEIIKSASGKLPIKFELLGFEDLDGKRTAKIKTTMTGTITIEVDAGGTALKGTNDFKSETTSWIDVTSGILQKSTGDATVTSAFDVGTQTQKIKVTVERVP